VPHANVVGDIGAGWAVTRGTLAHERRFGSRATRQFNPDATGRVIDEARHEAEEHEKTYIWYPQRQGRPELLDERARIAGRADDPLLRQEITKVAALQETAGWTAQRAKAARDLGRPPGSEGSIGKLATSIIARACNATHTSIAGAYGMLKESDDPMHATVAEVIVSTPAQSIAGGTDEIQHNILGENMLGLPKEPAADRGVPFREVGRS
jgi:alkylation response protein AidB-like acyl-CoA dehydrogenase